MALSEDNKEKFYNLLILPNPKYLYYKGSIFLVSHLQQVSMLWKKLAWTENGNNLDINRAYKIVVKYEDMFIHTYISTFHKSKIYTMDMKLVTRRHRQHNTQTTTRQYNNTTEMLHKGTL
jgi:hypothetical protein